MLEVKNVDLSIGGNQILKNVSFDVQDGEILSIIGPSGCGKSSILKSIAGVHKNISGSIKLNGKIITHQPIELRGITLVFQNYSLFPHMSVYENMLVGCDDKDKVDYILECICVDHLKSKFPHEMSGGEQQRIALARAIAHNPCVLLLDEPFSNVDSITTKKLRKSVTELLRQFGITTVMVTHDLDDVFEMSHRAVIMQSGKIIQFSELHNIYNKPKNEFVENLFGHVVEFDGKKYRPEQIVVHDNHSQDNITGIVKNIKFKLYHNEIEVEIHNKTVLLFDHLRKNFMIGDTIFLEFKNWIGK